MAAEPWNWLEATTVALAIRNSQMLTAGLSAVHVIGLTLTSGGALLSGLRLLGVVLADHPVPDVTGAARRGITVGLAISVTTGLLLFSTRASAAVENPIFRIKMLLLAAAALYHATAFRAATARTDPARPTRPLHGVLTLGLWIGLAAAGCAFILLE
jgi:hypothetical protein